MRMENTEDVHILEEDLREMIVEEDTQEVTVEEEETQEVDAEEIKIFRILYLPFHVKIDE